MTSSCSSSSSSTSSCNSGSCNSGSCNTGSCSTGSCTKTYTHSHSGLGTHSHRYRVYNTRSSRIRNFHDGKPLFYVIVAKWCGYSRDFVKDIFGRSVIRDGDINIYRDYAIEIVDIDRRTSFKKYVSSYPTIISGDTQEIISRGNRSNAKQLILDYLGKNDKTYIIIQNNGILKNLLKICNVF